MFWADDIAKRIEEKFAGEIKAGKTLVVRDEKTASGRVHIGSMRGASIHGIISEILTELGVINKFYWEVNDFDPMDGMPVYLDVEKYKEHMGKPLYVVPSPDGKAKNFAEYFAEEFNNVILGAGFKPEFYRASELYLSGRMNDSIRMALQKSVVIRKIYKEVSGSDRDAKWLPINIICEKCGKIGTTKATDFDGETVAYSCGDYVEWAKGCGHSGRVSPFDGRAKLPWKVEWAAKFKVMNVSVEGGGKDHSTKGGSRQVANRVCREVFNYEPPFDMPYEFFLVGGKKMSSSKGQGSSAREIADLMPPHIFRLALLGKDMNQAINFDPSGDTIPVLFDTYDKLAENYFAGVKDDYSRLFELCHFPSERKNITARFLPRFSQVAFMTQMPHINIEEEVEKLKGEKLTTDDREEISLRGKYAKYWLKNYADEQFKFEIQKVFPEAAKNFNEAQKNALRKVLQFIKESEGSSIDGQAWHTRLHEIRKEENIEPKDFFSAIYLSILGKENGPKAGWFLSVLDREFLEERLAEAIL